MSGEQLAKIIRDREKEGFNSIYFMTVMQTFVIEAIIFTNRSAWLIMGASLVATVSAYFMIKNYNRNETEEIMNRWCIPFRLYVDDSTFEIVNSRDRANAVFIVYESDYEIGSLIVQDGKIIESPFEEKVDIKRLFLDNLDEKGTKVGYGI